MIGRQRVLDRTKRRGIGVFAPRRRDGCVARGRRGEGRRPRARMLIGTAKAMPWAPGIIAVLTPIASPRW